MKWGVVLDKKKTIMDVAKLSGFSITTVSRVMNGNYPVKEETRLKIEAAIEELNFTPNILARGLIGAKTYSIGIIVPSIENLFFSEVIRGMDSILRSQGYSAFICATNEDVAVEKKYIRDLVDRKVDGIISISTDMRDMGRDYEALSRTLPLIIINGEQEGYDCYFLSSDQATGTRKALTYLYESGSRKIAFLRGHDSHSYNLKENVYRQFIRENSLPDDEGLLIRIEAGNSLETVHQGQEAMAEALGKTPDIDAVFACNDLMAVGVLNAAINKGYLIPRDLRIIGFDNTMTCELTQPTLSSVDQNMQKLGEGAVLKLLGLIDGEDLTSQKKATIDTQLVIRNT